MPVRSWRYIVRFKRGEKEKRWDISLLFPFPNILLLQKPETKSGCLRRADTFTFLSLAGCHSSEEETLFAQFNVLFCKKEKKTGRRLVNFNFWFQKLSNTAQMRNQFSQLPWLCGEANSCHWWAACHMTKSGISPAGPRCRHLNYRLPLVIYLHNISFSKHNSYLIHDSLRHSNCNIDWCGKNWSNFTCNFFSFALRGECGDCAHLL